MMVFHVAVLFLSLTLVVQSQECPPWLYVPDNASTPNCVCGDKLRNVVRCDESTQQVEILLCHGISYSDVYNTTVVGNLLLKCKVVKRYLSYYQIPKDLPAQELANHSCAAYKREGQLCGKCWDGHAPVVYSYSLACTRCDSSTWNVLKYICMAFLPVTAFYVLVVVLKFRATSPVVREFILFSQLGSTSFSLHLFSTAIFIHTKKENLYKLIFLTISGIWNLDFGRLLYKPFCLHPDLTMHQVIALDYLIAVYPLLLILLTYLLVKLHDSYRLAVLLWKPFHWCIRRIQREWDVKASLIDVFATFLLLSNVKLLNVSFDLISVPVTLWNVTGHSLPQKYTYLNGSLEYLGKEHLPYFVLGVTVILVFNVLPILLLCLYPFRWFQRCLNHCSLSSVSLHIFMDAFQGCYKTSPRDYRSLSALPLVIRLLNFILFSLTLNRFYYSLLGVLLILVAAILSSVQPFRIAKQNMASVVFHLCLASSCLLFNAAELTAYTDPLIWYLFFKLVSLSVLLVCTFVGLHFLSKLKMWRSLRRWWCGSGDVPADSAMHREPGQGQSNECSPLIERA